MVHFFAVFFFPPGARVERRFSCWYDNCFTDWLILPAPINIVFATYRVLLSLKACQVRASVTEFPLKSVWPHPHLSVSLASDAHCNNSFSQPPALPFLQFFSSMIQTQISSCFTIQVPCLASP